MSGLTNGLERTRDGASSLYSDVLGPAPLRPSVKRLDRSRAQFMNIDTNHLRELIDRTKEGFRFKYVGGGYFRDKNIPQGKKAELRHGEEIINEFCQELIKRATP